MRKPVADPGAEVVSEHSIGGRNLRHRGQVLCKLLARPRRHDGAEQRVGVVVQVALVDPDEADSAADKWYPVGPRADVVPDIREATELVASGCSETPTSTLQNRFILRSVGQT